MAVHKLQYSVSVYATADTAQKWGHNHAANHKDALSAQGKNL